MAGKRSYHEACGIARALDTVGERWALMVVREMLLGPKRFTDLRAGLPGVSPDVLTQRLKELGEAGIVQKRKLPPPAASQVYELTPAGFALEPVLVELGRWGGANAAPPKEGEGMSFDAHIVSLTTLFVPELAGDLATDVQLWVDGQPFRATVEGGHFHIERGTATGPELTLKVDEGTMLDVTHGRRGFDDAVEQGDLVFEGDAGLAERFMGLFPLPTPAPAPEPVAA